MNETRSRCVNLHDDRNFKKNAVTYPMGTGGKAAGVWSYHSPHSSAEVKNAWRYIYTPPQYVFMAWCLVKLRDNFTLLKRTNLPPARST
jgi:hypothetical protein